MDARQVIDELKALGLSEYEIAKRLPDVAQSTVNRIATGETPNPSYRVWRQLSDLLNVTQGNTLGNTVKPAVRSAVGVDRKLGTDP